MFAKLHDQFGSVGLALSALAIVFAFSGGAYAANNATASKAKQGKQGKPGKPGAPGATGPAGPAGLVGPKGEIGPAGAAGTNGKEGKEGKEGPEGPPGANGKSVLHGTAAPLDTQGNEGDFFIDTETDELFGPKAGGHWPTPGTSLKGSPWTAGGTLPQGATETGSFGVRFPGGLEAESEAEFEEGSISIPIPLPASLGAGEVHYVTFEDQEQHPDPVAACQGIAAAPTAAEGNLCVYEGERFASPEEPGRQIKVAVIETPVGLGTKGAATTGAVATVKYEKGESEQFARFRCTWAVTAP
ncbi:MAG: hypothetical protein WB507_10140 [Solirubrobacterales bacterium]